MPRYVPLSVLTTVESAEVVRRYAAGESTHELARAFAVSPGAIYRRIEDAGVTRKRHFPKCNEAFFGAIDSEEGAYWLGFIGADGTIDAKGTVQIRLAPKDKAHLERFKVAIKSDHRVYEYHRHRPEQTRGTFPADNHTAVLVINSKRMANDLIKAGCGPRKTATLEWPETLPDQLLRHYLRGYFDGDGGWRVAPDVPSAVSFGIAATLPWITGCQEYLQRTLGFPPVKPINLGYNVAVYRLQRGGGRKVGAFARFLYSDATIWLPRKRERIEHLLSRFESG